MNPLAVCGGGSEWIAANNLKYRKGLKTCSIERNRVTIINIMYKTQGVQLVR